MNAYIYQADIYCEDCGRAIRAELDKAGKAPEHTDDETTYDSDDYPKGPYPDGGREADSPQVCGSCGIELDNPPTEYGYAQEAE
jgi:hypothetical protein